MQLLALFVISTPSAYPLNNFKSLRAWIQRLEYNLASLAAAALKTSPLCLTIDLIILCCVGTGVIALLFQGFPYSTGSQILKIFTLIFFFLNLFLFVLFTAMTAIRYILFPKIWSLMIAHPVQGLYIGCFPMGLTTLINVAVRTIYQDYGFGGKQFLYALWCIWWFDLALSCLCVWGMVQIMYVSPSRAPF